MNGALLDTHVLLWAMFQPDRLSPALRAAVEAARPCKVSAVSVWEIGIKRALGKLPAPPDMVGRIRAVGFDLLPVSAEHAEAAAALPLHHHDPFDRMLVAQAQSEDVPIVTADAKLARYDVETRW